MDPNNSGVELSSGDSSNPVPSKEGAVKEKALRSLIEEVIKLNPDIETKCNVAGIISRMREWGISSTQTLDLALCDTPMVPKLTQHLSQMNGNRVSVCPPIFLSLLRFSKQEVHDASMDASAVVDQDAEEKTRPVPSILSRFFSTRSGLRSSLLELMVPPDHMPWFKKHWIESRRDDPVTLKEEFLFLAELELLFGSLLFAAVVGGFYQIADDSLVQAFKDMDMKSLGFWTGAVGSCSVILTIQQTGVAYITIFMFLPIHANNFYAYAKSTSVQLWLNFGTILLVTSFYMLIIFLALASSNILGGSWLVLTLTFGLAFLIVFPPFITLSTNALNLGMWSGSFGAVKVVEDQNVTEADAWAVDTVLLRRALTNIQSFGKPIPCDALYKQQPTVGNNEQNLLLGRRNQRQKLAAKTVALNSALSAAI